MKNEQTLDADWGWSWGSVNDFLGDFCVQRTGYGLRFNWSWEDRTFGWCSAFAELGIGTLILGPLFVQLVWPTDFWTK